VAVGAGRREGARHGKDHHATLRQFGGIDLGRAVFAEFHQLARRQLVAF